MYRRPDKLIAAMEKVNKDQLTRGVPADRTKKGPQIMGSGPIHRGSDRFMSKKQWETFYWPTWKKCIQRIIDLGYIVSIFTEGFVENRFEYFLEFPKGSLLLRFTDTDMFKAKEVLGDKFPIMGNVPSTLLQMGSPSDVDEYCRKLIQVCGKGGGYILRTDTDYIQESKPENVRAMIDSVEKYGRY
jgi:uroporphyrinogen-III decarboxylase